MADRISCLCSGWIGHDGQPCPLLEAFRRVRVVVTAPVPPLWRQPGDPWPSKESR